jgi:hypothetical protein
MAHRLTKYARGAAYTVTLGRLQNGGYAYGYSGRWWGLSAVPLWPIG